MKINLSDLERLATVTIPGPWYYDKERDQIRTENPPKEEIHREITTAYICAMNPQTALALIRIAKAAKEFMAEYVTMRGEILASVGAEKNLEKALEGVE